MATLLDFNDPNIRTGFGLLALSQAPRSQFAQGLNSLFANEAAMKQQEMQRQVMQSQIDENRTQNQQREMQMRNAMAQQERENAFFGLGGGQAATQGAGVISQGQEAQAAQSTPSDTKFDQWSREFGIPKDALMVDWMRNGGKGIADMLMKRGTPDMQVTNGYAYDKNRLGAGFMPSLTTSQDGKTSIVRIGPDGQPIISAPQGAAETYATYQAAQSAFKPIKVYNPETGREEYTTEATVVGGRGAGNVTPQRNYTGPGYAGGSSQAAAQGQLEVMQSELNKLPPDHPDRPAIMREMARLGGGQALQRPLIGPQSGNYAAGPSATEAAAAEANRVRAVDTAKADVVRDTGVKAESKRSNQFMVGIDRAIDLLGQSPTASGVGAAVDKGLSAFGFSTKGSSTAAQLETLSGWLVSNVPRMEGPQSNIDVQNYQVMAGLVGDRTKPVEVRLAAAQEVKRLIEKYDALNAGGGQAQGQAAQTQQREFSMLPNATQFDGRRMRAPDGSIYRSAGGKWVKE